MNWPYNAEILQGIARDTFFGTIQNLEKERLYPRLCQEKPQKELTVTYTSFGEVPEPRQLSGTVASGGQRQAHGLADYKMVGTVAEWEQTVTEKRSVVETNPEMIQDIVARMARKASMFMDRRLIATVLPASTAGYDGVSLYNDAHPESGTNQDNNVTSAAATGTKPTPAEIESELDLEIGIVKGFTDNKGSPVNEGVNSWTVLVPLGFEHLYKTILEPLKGQMLNYDASSGTGRFRGMFNVYGSAFVATADRHYLFANRPDTTAVRLLKNKDFEFKTNIGTDSDAWNFGQTAIFYSYARWEFIPWDWKTTLRQVWT